MKTAQPILYLSDTRGVYIPRDFVNETKPECLSGVDEETLATLRNGPDDEWYWEAWENLCNNATVTDPETGVRYTVYQDGDCWLIPEGWTVNDAGEFVKERN